MSDELQLLLEDASGQREARCERFALRWEGRELWIQPGPDGQLMIGVEDLDGATEYANLVLRPHASNLVSLALEFEPAEGDDHHHGPGCGCEH